MSKMHAYVDGFNLYKGMMDPKNNMPGAIFPPPVFRQFLWLDLQGYVESFFDGSKSLDVIHYVTAPMRKKPNSLKRQQTYWKALESNENLRIHLGKFLPKYGNGWKFKGWEEKQSDVRFGLQVLEDVLTIPELETIALVCADSDQIPTVERVLALRPDISIQLIFPPHRKSGALEKMVPGPFETNYHHLQDNQFPNTIEYERNGSKISVTKPAEWS